MASYDSLIRMRISEDSPIYNEFCEFQKKLQVRLRDLRKERGLTQLDMEDCGISSRHYERLEQDFTAITSVMQLYRIAAFYEMPLIELLDVDRDE